MWWNAGPHLQRRMMQQAGQTEGKRSASYHGTDFHSDVEEFKAVLCSKYGSVTRAWRVALDADDSGFLDMPEFCSATRAIGYVGDLRTLWYNLDRFQIGRVGLSALDDRAADALEKFRVLATNKYGTIEECWTKLLDDDASGFVQQTEFCGTVKTLGYDDEDEVLELFRLLIVRPGSTSLEKRDIMFLEKWHQTRVEEEYRKRVPISWMNGNPNLVILRMERDAAAKHRVSIADMDATRTGQFPEAKQEEERQALKDFLVQRYGSMVAAFHAIDANGSAALTMTEFQNVVASQLRYCRRSDAKRLFLLFNDDCNGVVTWENFGVTLQEWTHYRIKKRAEAEQRRVAEKLRREAPLGKGPRMLRAIKEHCHRLNEAPSGRDDVAFWKPMPAGWGPPPSFAPVAPLTPLTARGSVRAGALAALNR